jgi:anti-anti-sigma regulatory factor
MNNGSPGLSIWVGDQVACIKVTGRASFNYSVNFRKVVLALHEQQPRRFILDLTRCPLMDSTFAGILAKLGGAAGGSGAPGPRIDLLNPSEHITEMLDTLGVAGRFETHRGPAFDTAACQELPAGAALADRKETTRACLEAHQALMEINPANVPKFKDVTKFLAEDLKRMES